MRIKKAMFLLIFSLNLSCTNVDSIIEDIAKDKILHSENIGITSTKSEQYLKFQILKSKASNDKVIGLLKHNNPILRNFAYKTLIDRNLMLPSEAFQEAMSNNETISQLIGDQIMSTDICTELYFETINFYTNLKKEEIALMDSLILFEFDESHRLLHMAIDGKKHSNNLNDRIITLAIDYGNFYALSYIGENNIHIDESKFTK